MKLAVAGCQSDITKLRALVIANGPSSGLLNLENLNCYDIVIAMNSSFRAWKESSFRPTHFIALDSVLTESILNDIVELSTEAAIEKFLLNDTVFELKTDVWEESAADIRGLQNLLSVNPSFSGIAPYVTTGSVAILWAASEGADEIDLIGFDGIREEFLPTSEKVAGEGLPADSLVMSETPKFNPNYSDPNYQSKGDRYRTPNLNGFTRRHGIRMHDKALLTCREILNRNYSDIKLRNFSLGSVFDVFPKVGLPPALLAQNLVVDDGQRVYPTQLLSDKVPIQFGSPTAPASTPMSWLSTQSAHRRFALCCAPTLVVRIDKSGLPPSITPFRLYGAILKRSIIEWEIYDLPELDAADSISRLPIDQKLKMQLLRYERQIFCNFSSADERAQGAAIARLAFKNMIFSREQKVLNISEANRLASFQRLTNQTVDVIRASSAEGGPRIGGSSQALIFRHAFLGVLQRIAVRVELEGGYLLNPRIAVYLAGQRISLHAKTSYESAQAQVDSIYATSFIPSDQWQFILKIEAMPAPRFKSLSVMFQSSQGHIAMCVYTSTELQYLFPTNSAASLQSPVSNVNSLDTDSSERTAEFFWVEPDLVDARGHPCSVAVNIARAAARLDLKVTVLGPIGCPASIVKVLSDAGVRVIETYSKRSWQIETALWQFLDETRNALSRGWCNIERWKVRDVLR